MRACYELITRELQILLKLSFLEDVSADLTKPQHNPLPPTPKPSAFSGGVGALPSAPCRRWGGMRRSRAGWVTDSEVSGTLASSLAAGTQPPLFNGILEGFSVSRAAVLVYLCSGNLQNYNELHPARSANSPHL